MAAPATGSLLMRRYGDVANPIPGEQTLAKDLKFLTQYKTGEDFRFPVRLGLEQGATYNTDHGLATLNAAVDGTYSVASLEGAEIFLRATFSYGEMSRLSANKGRSDKAFDQAVGLKIANLMDAGEQHRDISLLYGAGSSGLANIGVVSAVPVASVGGVVTLNISRATFIPGFWQEFIGGKVDVYTAGGAIRNATTDLQVTGVDITRCRVTLTGLQAETNAIVATDVFFLKGARAKQMVGIQAILENTGTLFGISAATYPQWKGVQYAVGGALDFDKVAEGLSNAADNGLTSGCTLYVNPRTWTDLMTNEAALRRRTSDSSKAKSGYGDLEFEMNCGVVKVKQYRYMKQGIAIALPTQDWHRVGSTDLTFTLPGSPNEFFYRELETQGGSEIRIYTDQAVCSEAPFRSVLFSGISNSADCIPS